MMKTSLLLLAALVVAPFASAQQALQISDTGVLTAGNTTWRTLFMDQKWSPLTQDKHFVVESSENGNYQGAFKRSGESLFDFSIDYASTGAGYQITSEVANPTGVECKMLAYQGTLNTYDFAGDSILLDGKPIVLPVEYSGKDTVAIQYAYSVSVPTSAGDLVFKGGFDVLIVDARKYNDTKFFVRLMYNPSKGPITSSKFEAKVTLN
jgi:hypothetical protein